MKLTLDLDLKKCTSCGACAIACMDQNDIDVERGIRPFRTVFDWENKTGGTGRKFIHISIACMHCTDAPCVLACPSACISKDKETNLTVFDNTNCIGCHSCAMACPFGIPSFGEEGKMQKCDGCAVRVKNGMEPACVRACPVQALKLVDIDAENSQTEGASLQKLGKEILEFQT
ncbi:MAG TPA: 4Fe-4S binding protein [Candidatus Ventrimonas merdavium]|nr:4Fe-4S binding protein [Candidatus Ventrimonas merdavium]